MRLEGDRRYYVIALLAIVAAVLGYYRYVGTPEGAPGTEAGRSLFSSPAQLSSGRLRSIIDTTAKILGAPRKFIVARTVSDSGRPLPEIWIGVPASFDDLRLINALTDSLRGSGCTVTAHKSLKEKTTTIRISDRAHTSLYRLILYRKELSH